MNKTYSFMVLLLLGFGASVEAATTTSLYPSGDGVHTAWTPSTAGTHAVLVDESTCNGTTDYVSETTVGDRDSYTVSLASVPAGAVITNIAVTPCASRNSTGAGSATLNVFYRFDGVQSADAGAYSLPTGTTPSVRATTNFGSLALTKTASSALEVGVVYSAGTKGVRVSNVATVITYTAVPNAPTNLFAVASSTGTSSFAALFWTDNSSDETGFKVERSLDGVNFSLLTTRTVANYNDFAVSAGNTYYYRITAYNTVGNSAYTTVKSVTF
jgi:hypothetical protein